MTIPEYFLLSSVILFLGTIMIRLDSWHEYKSTKAELTELTKDSDERQ